MIYRIGRIAGAFLTLSLLLGSIACGPPSGDWSGTSPDPPLELTDEAVREGVNGRRVYDVPPLDGQGDTISWGFDDEEPKEITIVDRVDEDDRITIILDITTRSTPRAREPKELTGRIKTFWEVERGLALRRWEIQRIENISMKYKNLPKPPGPTPRGDVEDFRDVPPSPPPFLGNANVSTNTGSNQAPPSPRR